MEIIKTLFETILYQPLFNVLVLIYQYFPLKDLGISIILLTILVKLVLFPLGSKAIKSQKALSDIQPKIKEIQEKYKDNKEEQTKKVLEFYKKERINPFSGCLPILIQLPILIALFRLFRGGIDLSEASLLYPFVPYPGTISTFFLGFLDLAVPNKFLAVLAGILQFFQAKATLSRKKTEKKKSNEMADMMQKQMLFFLPIFTIIILFRLPSAMGLYWITTTIFTIVQQYLIFKKKEK